MKLRLFAATAALLCLLPLAAACSAAPDLAEYVSEYRSRLYSGTEGEYTVVASFSERETPYCADGNVGNMTQVFEVTLAAADNTRTYAVQFCAGGKEYCAELSFDSVRMVHSYSQSMPAPEEQSVAFTFTDTEDETFSLTVTAQSARLADTLELPALLDAVYAAERERFDALSDGRIFRGELYVRLLAEDGENYFYVGLTDRDGRTYSMLADGATGAILATHE